MACLSHPLFSLIEVKEYCQEHFTFPAVELHDVESEIGLPDTSKKYSRKKMFKANCYNYLNSS